MQNGNFVNEKENKEKSGFSFSFPLSSTKPIADNNSISFEKSPPNQSSEESKPINSNVFASAASKYSQPTETSSETANVNQSSNLFSAENKKTEVPFLTNNSLSFAALAQDSKLAAPSFIKTATSPGNFFGLTNRDTFNNLMGPSNNSGPADSHETVNENEHVDDVNYDPHYEPIIALPDEIHVSTGEEEEKKLFGERARLYRYDATNKEWKERGVGELKILHHPVMGSYRLLLRREQIHKLVLNLALNCDFQINPMKQSDKAFCWVAQNFAEDQQNGELESLSVRFKNADLANKFFEIIRQCIDELKVRGE